VFLCRVEEDTLKQLTTTMRTIIDTATDSIYVFRQCQDCWSTVETIGQASPPEPTLYWAVL
jgi:CRISPR-associated protein Cas2